MTTTPPQLATHLEPYEMGNLTLQLKRPGTLARLELEESCPSVLVLVGGGDEDTVQLTADDARTIQAWLEPLIVSSTLGGKVHELAAGWLDHAGPAVFVQP